MSLHLSFHISLLVLAAAAILFGSIAQALGGFWREARKHEPRPDRQPRPPADEHHDQLEQPLVVDFDFPARALRRAQERPRDRQGGTK